MFCEAECRSDCYVGGRRMDRRSLCLFVLLVVLARSDAMSKEQFKNTGKMLQKQCIGKTGATLDQVIDIDKGKFIEEKNVMCYIACIYQMTQIVKNNKLNLEASIKQINIMYPTELKEPAKVSIEKCKDVQKKYKDLCEASYWTTKCLYEDNPQAFIFP